MSTKNKVQLTYLLISLAAQITLIVLSWTWFGWQLVVLFYLVLFIQNINNRLSLMRAMDR
jgi:hypothetical protein